MTTAADIPVPPPPPVIARPLRYEHGREHFHPPCPGIIWTRPKNVCHDIDRIGEVKPNMVVREYRQYTPEEKERISRSACPCCGRERSDFREGNEHTICCQPSCSMEYWFKIRPTISGIRRCVLDEQDGCCAICRQLLHGSNAGRGQDKTHRYVLDHIRPIAMGGDQWARDNLQVLCVRCNRIKTARDLGRIAQWKKYYLRGPAHQVDNSRQVLLFPENFVS